MSKIKKSRGFIKKEYRGQFSKVNFQKSIFKSLNLGFIKGSIEVYLQNVLIWGQIAFKTLFFTHIVTQFKNV